MGASAQRSPATRPAVPCRTWTLQKNSRFARKGGIYFRAYGAGGAFYPFWARRRFVKEDCRENGKRYCMIASAEDVQVVMAPNKTKFARWAAKQFEAMGGAAPAGWRRRFDSCPDPESSEEEDESSEDESSEEWSDDEASSEKAS